MNKINYDEIRSLKDLRAERRRVNRDINRLKRDMGDNRMRISQMLTPEYLIGSLSGTAGRVYSVAQSVFAGYSFIKDLISARKQKKNRKKSRRYYSECY